MPANSYARRNAPVAGVTSDAASAASPTPTKADEMRQKAIERNDKMRMLQIRANARLRSLVKDLPNISVAEIGSRFASISARLPSRVLGGMVNEMQMLPRGTKKDMLHRLLGRLIDIKHGKLDKPRDM